jgi:AAA domain
MTTSINPRPARRTQRKGRILLWGKSGSGKTLTSLKLARGLAGPVGTICVIDTDYEASTLYADAYRFDIEAVDPPFEPDKLTLILKALGPRYDVLVLDTGTHEWTGEGGCLEIRDREALRLKDNSWAAWAKVTPAHQRFLEALTRCPAHLIVTLRAKTVTEQTKDEKGKPVVLDLGLFPQQRYDGEEFVYGLDISGRLEPEGQGVRLSITTTRYQAWHGASFLNPDEALGAELATWLNQGAIPSQAPATSERQASPEGLDDRGRAAIEARLVTDTAPPPSEPPRERPTEPPASPPADRPRPTPASPQSRTGSPSRGERVGAITTELFRLVPGRGDDGRRQRLALLEGCSGKPTMREVATLADDVLEAGLQRLLAKGEGRPTPTRRRRGREPGEEG